MSSLDRIFFVIFTGLFLYGVWKLLPRSIYLVSPGATHFFFDVNRNKSAQLFQQEDLRALANQLEAMGFYQIGIKVEHPPLWGSNSELSFALGNEHIFASIAVVNGKIVYYFFTPFTGGQAVLTANANFPTANAPDILQTTLIKSAPAALLALHRKHVEEFTKQGFTPYPEYNKQTRLEATSLYYKINTVRKKMRLLGAVHLFFLMIICLPFAYFLLKAFRSI
jgi:hypothetical protein